jgi:hypothetical protein
MYWFDVYIYNISVPSYLTDILPPRISETTNYPLGNSEDFTIRSYRLTLINSSFFPSTLRARNSLDLENINASSYINLKKQLVNKTLVPVWYSTGVRKWNIIHTKLRYNYSTGILTYDLFRFNLNDKPGCACGFECEKVIHFFLECPINEHIINTLFLILQIYGAIDIILHGNENLTEAQMLIFLQQFKCSYVIVIGLIDWLLQVLLSLVLFFPLFVVKSILSFL